MSKTSNCSWRHVGDPRFLDRSGIQKFNVVVANPSFSLKNWGVDTWINDPYDRAFCGVPPAGTADFAWVQHMVASMDESRGRVGVVMPHGVLFRGGAEGRIRRCLVDEDLLEGIIGLPPNLFYSTSIPACLLIFRAQKAHANSGRVIFVDGSTGFTKGRNQNYMSSTEVDAILAAYRAPEQMPEGSKVNARLVSRAEIEENSWDLNISRYIRSSAAITLSVAEALDRLIEIQVQLHEAEENLLKRLRGAGYA